MGKIKQNNINITKVIFRKFKEGDIIALFPEESSNLNYNNCLSYMQIGQHSAASVFIIKDTKPALPEEYASLKNELENVIGYNLKIVSRVSYEMDKKRIEKIRAIKLT